MDPQNQNHIHPLTQWTRFEDKQFEKALVYFPEEIPDRWHKIADRIPGKSAGEVKQHFDMLLHDVYEIDAGRIKVPNYADDFSESLGWDSDNQISFASKPKQQQQQQQIDNNERKKGTPWTEDEHKLFLLGLSQYGKGDWRSISRNVVITRTPTQVASHAQKFYLRQTSGKKERKRSSIHDITRVDVNAPVEQSLVSLSSGTVQQPSLLQQLPSVSHTSTVSIPVEQSSVHMPRGPVQQPSTLQELPPPNHLAPDGRQLPPPNHLAPDGRQLPPPNHLPSNGRQLPPPNHLPSNGQQVTPPNHLNSDG